MYISYWFIGVNEYRIDLGKEPFICELFFPGCSDCDWLVPGTYEED